LTAARVRAIKRLRLTRKPFDFCFMTDLRREFEQAAEEMQRLHPDNDTRLKLYALFKQGSEGDLSREKPGFFDFIGTAKHEAWAKLSGLSQEEAMRRYIALSHQLLA